MHANNIPALKPLANVPVANRYVAQMRREAHHFRTQVLRGALELLFKRRKMPDRHLIVQI